MEKVTNFRKIREFRGKTPAQVVKGTGISKQNISEWDNGPGEPGKKFIDQLVKFFQVPKEFFYVDGLTKEYLEKHLNSVNPTHMDIVSDNNGKAEPSVEEAIRHLIEGNTDYILMHKIVIMDKYRLVSIEEIEKTDKELEKKHIQIEGLYEIIKAITSKLPEPFKLPEMNKAK